MVSLTIDGKAYSESELNKIIRSLDEQKGYRLQDVRDAVRLFECLFPDRVFINEAIQYRLSRVAGTTLLEALYILMMLDEVRHVDGDWCEYGVAHGRTSALLAQAMLTGDRNAKLWLYDSFEGLPQPHAKDILLNDIFSKGDMAAYAGTISFPERVLRDELASVKKEDDFYHIHKGWISREWLSIRSPERIAFAYLDMDLYESTYDTLGVLVEKMPRGGVAVIDDYDYFSSGVKTAVDEICQQYPGMFVNERPFRDKFIIMRKQF